MIQSIVPIALAYKIHSYCDADVCRYDKTCKLVLRYNHFRLILPLLKQYDAGLLVMDAHKAHKVGCVSNQDTLDHGAW